VAAPWRVFFAAMGLSFVLALCFQFLEWTLLVVPLCFYVINYVNKPFLLFLCVSMSQII
jgi:hypothetical protein